MEQLLYFGVLRRLLPFSLWNFGLAFGVLIEKINQFNSDLLIFVENVGVVSLHFAPYLRKLVFAVLSIQLISFLLNAAVELVHLVEQLVGVLFGQLVLVRLQLFLNFLLDLGGNSHPLVLYLVLVMLEVLPLLELFHFFPLSRLVFRLNTLFLSLNISPQDISQHKLMFVLRGVVYSDFALDDLLLGLLGVVE